LSAVKPKRIDEEAGYGILLEKMRKIEAGGAYALEEPSREYAFKLLNDCVKNGFRKKFSGYAVYSRVKPSTLAALNIFKKENTCWFTTNRDTSEKCFNPTDIPAISASLMENIKGEKAVLVEGVEYLVTQNGFTKINNLKEYVYDHISGSKAAIIWNYDPHAFESEQLHLLRRCSLDVRNL